MLEVGIAFLLFATLIQFFGLTIIAAAAVTGIIFVVLSFLMGNRPVFRR